LCFEKIFGYPTQLGALLTRKNSSWPSYSQFHLEGKAVKNPGEALHARNVSASRIVVESFGLEFQSILDIGYAVGIHRKLHGPNPMEAVFRHTMSLTQILVNQLQKLVHATGKPVVSIYESSTHCSWSSSTHGPVIAINVMRADGSFVECRDVAEAAASHGIRITSQALCDSEVIETDYQWNIARIEPSRWLRTDPEARLSRRPNGVVHVSLGAMSTSGDVLVFTNFIRESYAERGDPPMEALLRKVEAWRTSVV
jgi:molybdenum cofactor sulfurtransferase